MKLYFNKEDLTGHWFNDTDDTTGYTQKVPPYNGVVFDEEQNKWITIVETETTE